MNPDDHNIFNEPYPMDSAEIMALIIFAGMILGGLITIGLFLLY